MERTLSESTARRWASRSRRTMFAAAADSGCTCGSGATRRGRRSCSSTAGRSASCAGRSQIAGTLAERVPASSPSTSAGHGMSEKPPGAEHYVDARLWADDLAAVIEQTGLDRPVLVGVVLRRVRRDRLSPRLRRGGDRRHRPRRRARCCCDPAASSTSGPGLLENAGDAVAPTCRRTSPLSAASCARARPSRSRPRLERRAVLEHGRAARGPRRAVRARDRADDVLAQPVGPRARDARSRRRDRAARRWRSTCWRSARRRRRRGTRASVTCRSWRIRRGSTASLRSSSSWLGGDGGRQAAIARRSSSARPSRFSRRSKRPAHSEPRSMVDCQRTCEARPSSARTSTASSRYAAATR